MAIQPRRGDRKLSRGIQSLLLYTNPENPLMEERNVMSNFWKLNDEARRLLDALDEIAQSVIGPDAVTTDKEGRFPKENIDALRKAGLLSLVSAKNVGGQGQGLR